MTKPSKRKPSKTSSHKSPPSKSVKSSTKSSLPQSALLHPAAIPDPILYLTILQAGLPPREECFNTYPELITELRRLQTEPVHVLIHVGDVVGLTSPPFLRLCLSDGTQIPVLEDLPVEGIDPIKYASGFSLNDFDPYAGSDREADDGEDAEDPADAD